MEAIKYKTTLQNGDISHNLVWQTTTENGKVLNIHTKKLIQDEDLHEHQSQSWMLEKIFKIKCLVSKSYAIRERVLSHSLYTLNYEYGSTLK